MKQQKNDGNREQGKAVTKVRRAEKIETADGEVPVAESVGGSGLPRSAKRIAAVPRGPERCPNVLLAWGFSQARVPRGRALTGGLNEGRSDGQRKELTMLRMMRRPRPGRE